jgi:pectate lyase
VRFGQVHLYNNYYKSENLTGWQYSWGVGAESQIYAENNFFKTDASITPDRIISRLNGASIFESGTYLNGTAPSHLVDLVAAYNAVHDPDLIPTVGWAPTFFTTIQPTCAVPSAVQNNAGPFIW